MSKRPPSRVLSAIWGHHWAMLPEAFDLMMEIVGRRFTGEMLSPADRSAAIEAARKPEGYVTAPSTIAVMPLYGVLAPRAGAFQDISQEGTPLDAFTSAYSSAMRDPQIGGVIVVGDTPGGSVFGVEESADAIFALRDVKPNVIVGTGHVASAGLWIGSQFREAVASPSSEWGSVGILQRHENMQKAAEMAGVEVRYITSPKGGNKAEGNPFEPLSEEAEQHYQARSDEYYDAFLRQLARGRGTKPAAVRESYGKGRMYGAKVALSLGMVDRIGTLQGEIDRMAAKLAKRGAGARAEAGGPPLMAEAEPVAAADVGLPRADGSVATKAIGEDGTRKLALAKLRLAGAGR